MAVARESDGVLLVVDAHGTHRGALLHTREQLDQSGANMIGAIMNDFDPAKARAYGNRYYGRYYYPYSYTYGGRYGYAAYSAEPENGSSRAPREVPLEVTEHGS